MTLGKGYCAVDDLEVPCPCACSLSRDGVRLSEESYHQDAVIAQIARAVCPATGPEVGTRVVYDIEQNPTVPGGKKPDYRIEGQIFDNYAPSSDNARNIATNIKDDKVTSGQADRIVLNLADSAVDLDKMRAQLRDWPIEGLQEVILIDRQGNVLHFYP